MREEEVLEDIRGQWRRLKHLLATEPYRWSRSLRRVTFAKAIRGSNSIEGIEVSPEDALAAVDLEEPIEASEETRKAISGYHSAMTYVLRLATDPGFRYDENLLRGLHYIMLHHEWSKHPGTWRPGPVHVQDGATGQIVYRAPREDLVPLLMQELTEGLRAREDASPMVRAAMAHLNLVMIHPFSDGNGRMARCLQTLVLARAGVLDSTFCSIEEYLGANSQAYYRVLAQVGGGSWKPNNDALPWVRFNLTAHYRQAGTALRRQQEHSEVWGEVEELCSRLGVNSRCVPSLCDAAFGARVQNRWHRQHAEVSQVVASRDLAGLVKLGLLEAEGKLKGRYYLASVRLRELRDRHRHKKPIEDPFERAG